MNEENSKILCIGVLGKLFGHSFKKYLVKQRYVQTPNVSFDIHGHQNALSFLDAQRDVYIVRCKRCGFNPAENKEP